MCVCVNKKENERDARATKVEVDTMCTVHKKPKATVAQPRYTLLSPLLPLSLPQYPQQQYQRCTYVLRLDQFRVVVFVITTTLFHVFVHSILFRAHDRLHFTSYAIGCDCLRLDFFLFRFSFFNFCVFLRT